MLFSYSGLSSSDGPYGCWQKIWFHYGLGLAGTPTPALTFGKAAHAVIETLIRRGTYESLGSMIEALASTLEFSAEEIDDLRGCVNADAVKEAVQSTIESHTEEYLEMPLDNTPFSPMLRGYIDYYYMTPQAVFLTDWKTNRAVYDPMDTYQLSLYAGYLSKKYSLPVVGSLVFLRFNKRLTHQFTEEEIKKANIWALDTALECECRFEKVKAGKDPLKVFPRQPGKACEYCGFKNLCLKNTGEIPEAVVSRDDAVQTMQWILAAREALKIHEGNLKNFIQKQGPVEDDNFTASINTSEYFRFDVAARKAVVKKMQEQKINIGSVLKIGSDAQNDLQNKYGWTEKDFISLGAKKGSASRLSIEKVEPEKIAV